MKKAILYFLISIVSISFTIDNLSIISKLIKGDAIENCVELDTEAEGEEYEEESTLKYFVDRHTGTMWPLYYHFSRSSFSYAYYQKEYTHQFFTTPPFTPPDLA